MHNRPVQNEVDVGKLTGPDIFPWFGSSEVHWYHFHRKSDDMEPSSRTTKFEWDYPLVTSSDEAIYVKVVVPNFLDKCSHGWMVFWGIVFTSPIFRFFLWTVWKFKSLECSYFRRYIRIYHRYMTSQQKKICANVKYRWPDLTWNFFLVSKCFKWITLTAYQTKSTSLKRFGSYWE